MGEEATEPPADARLPPPLPGEEAAARRARNLATPPDESVSSQLRRASKPVLIGLVGLAISVAIPIVIVVILAILAQVIITGH